MATISTHPAAKSAGRKAGSAGPRPLGKRDASSAEAFLEQSLARRWKTLGKRLRRALPAAGPASTRPSTTCAPRPARSCPSSPRSSGRARARR